MRTAQECIEEASRLLSLLEGNLRDYPNYPKTSAMALEAQANIDLARYLREEEQEASQAKKSISSKY